MKDPDAHLLSQIQKAHSIGSIVTMISFIANTFASRIEELNFLTIPLILVVCLTIIASSYYFFQSIKHKENIENPVKNNIAFIFRIAINVVLLILMII